MTRIKTEKILDLGKRKVSTMNFSKVVTLPKAFTDNWLTQNSEVKMEMSYDGKLTLIPIKQKRSGSQNE